MTRRITAALGAAALAVGLGVVGAPSASAAGCHHWQYKITEEAGVYTIDGLRSGTAYRGYYLNASGDDGPLDLFGRYYGIVYDANKQRERNGGVLKTKLDYVTCW